MLTPSQRKFITASLAAVTAALALPTQSCHSESLKKELIPRLLAKCGGTEPEARAFWYLAFYLGKPSRIPSGIGHLLQMSDESAFAAALVSEFGEWLHRVIPQKAIDRMNNIDFAHTA